MSNIGATNSSNIDAQLAAKRAEEERKKAEAAKLEAEQKAKAEEKKAQADAKAADAQKGKDVPAAKPKAEDVSIHTAKIDDKNATQTSAAKTSVHTQAAETNSQETRAAGANSSTPTVDYGEYLRHTITGGGASLFNNQFSTETTLEDTVNLSGKGQISYMEASSPLDGYENVFDKGIENTGKSNFDLFKPSQELTLTGANIDYKDENGLSKLDRQYHDEMIELMVKDSSVESFDSFVSVYKETDELGIYSEDHLKRCWDFSKNEFYKTANEKAIFTARYIAEAFKKNPSLKDDFLNNFESLPVGLQCGFIKLLDNPECAEEVSLEIKNKMHSMLTSPKVDLSTKFFAVATVLQSKNYDDAAKLRLIKSLQDDEILKSLNEVAAESENEDIRKVADYLKNAIDHLKKNSTSEVVAEVQKATGEVLNVGVESAKNETDAEERLNHLVDAGALGDEKTMEGFVEGSVSNGGKHSKFVAKFFGCCGGGPHKIFCEAYRKALKKDSQTEEFKKSPERRHRNGELAAIVTGSGQNPEEVKKRAEDFANDGILGTREAATGFAQESLKNDDAEKTIAMANVVNNENVNSAVIDAYVEGLPKAKQEAQIGVYQACNMSKRATVEQREGLARVTCQLHESNQSEAAELFLAEKRNTESARVMEAFATQIPNLKVSIEDRTAVYNQVSALNIVNASVLQETRNQLATQYYELTNRTDFDDFVNTIGSNSANMNVGASVNVASTVPISGAENISAGTAILSNTTDFSANDRALGLWGVAKSVGIQIREALLKYGLANGVKPTISQFVDMLDKEILSAEVVVKAGYKDALIQQFSSLSSDAQYSVLETLTIEEKIMMRQKGLLPRRFWDQVEKQVAQKVLDGGDVSTSDASLLARTASNSVLYQCLNDSSIRLSAQSRSLFQKTLIDNHYLKRDVNGQYKKLC